ncbi:MAG: sigma-54 dependent transcriptional regulator [Pseudomonadota bacterium]
MQKKLLIADDEYSVRASLSLILGKKYSIVEADSFTSCIDAYKNNDISLTILDIDFKEDKDGLNLLKQIRQIDKSAPVIMLSDIISINKIVESMKLGAYDYIAKSSDNLKEDLLIRIENCLRRSVREKCYELLKTKVKKEHHIVTQDKSILAALNEINSIGEMNILIEGETGVGKTPVALYANTVLSSSSKARPFVRINCAGLNRARLQDELFGHKKGAYTGAENDKQGLVELANNGDLFFDEIGDLDLECQAELLMFLDSGEFRRLGDPILRSTNCRIVCATNSNLKQKVNDGSFRHDLYSRISQCPFVIPPLRDRKQDIKIIMEYYINEFAGFDKPYEKKILETFNDYHWYEGNVRELKNAVLYMCQKSKKEEMIKFSHINYEYLKENSSFNNNGQQKLIDKEKIFDLGLENYLKYIEKDIYKEIIDGEKDLRILAKKLKVPESTFYRKLKSYKISKDY